MAFFKNFPTRQFNLNNTNEIVNVKDIFRHVDVDDLAIDPFSTYTYYEIQLGDRPDNVSQKLYGTTDFYWTFFILNDYLKEGIGAWPKSQQELTRYITEQFDKYSVVQFLPGPFSTSSGLRTFEQTFEGSTAQGFYTNTFLGLDLSHPYLRIRKNDTSNAYALIDRFDPSMYQLFIHKITNSNQFFSREEASYGIEVYNPHPTQDPMYQEVEQLNDAWLEKALAWAIEGYPSIANPVMSGVSTINRREYLRKFQEKILLSGLIGWTSSRSFFGRNAHVSYSNPTTGEPMTAYDVYRGTYQSTTSGGVGFPVGSTLYGPGLDGAYSSGVNIQTRYDVEVEKNDAKRKIRVIKKSQINAFVEEFKKKLV